MKNFLRKTIIIVTSTIVFLVLFGLFNQIFVRIALSLRWLISTESIIPVQEQCVMDLLVKKAMLNRSGEEIKKDEKYEYYINIPDKIDTCVEQKVPVSKFLNDDFLGESFFIYFLSTGITTLIFWKGLFRYIKRYW